jgi:hypothetical protein
MAGPIGAPADILADRAVDTHPADLRAGRVAVEAVVEVVATAAEAMVADTGPDTADRRLLERAHQIDPALMPCGMARSPHTQIPSLTRS